MFVRKTGEVRGSFCGSGCLSDPIGFLSLSPLPLHRTPNPKESRSGIFAFWRCFRPKKRKSGAWLLARAHSAPFSTPVLPSSKELDVVNILIFRYFSLGSPCASFFFFW